MVAEPGTEPAFFQGSAILALNGHAVLDHCSAPSGPVVIRIFEPNNVKGGNHGQNSSLKKDLQPLPEALRIDVGSAS